MEVHVFNSNITEAGLPGYIVNSKSAYTVVWEPDLNKKNKILVLERNTIKIMKKQTTVW